MSGGSEFGRNLLGPHYSVNFAQLLIRRNLARGSAHRIQIMPFFGNRLIPRPARNGPFDEWATMRQSGLFG
jgi:hypothetical protein